MYKYWLTIFGLFIIDRLTKLYFLKNSSLPGGWGEFFSLYLNQYIAFSIPLAIIVIYVLVSVILLGLIFVWWKNFKKQHVLYWPISLVIIGAVSNLLDRINYGAVIDFINLPFFSVFNLSDVYITSGVIWIVYFELIYKRRQKIS
jgi:signal peptidase II